ncbi:site-specific DNA-methyltransferase [Altericroceibacterium spongiae]|uniref:site-specific DNA-methyltransferase (adenine-specific) n=1 Tax=Altericroceibacterium spongiae TaxID=2320269 RepID=A0A420ES89_9SPHN|nr:site-specific DNA-methyltransferase [Altericroceibacterium spongiae]
MPFRPLVPDQPKGIGPVALDGNLIVHGDNLQALKALLPHYAGKVDCIFIDPPYNTGNEGWCYNDNVNAPMIKEWLESNPIGVEDGLRHDKWCAMMWPRLRLLYELLGDEGTIWVTLDDNEIHRARGILDEIFGEESFVCQIVTQSNKRGQTYKEIAKTHEYILVYGKTPFSVLHEIETEGENLPEKDDFGKYSARELRNRNPKFGRHNRPNLFYPFYAKSGFTDDNGNHYVSVEPFEGAEEIFPLNSSGGESCWRWGKDRSRARTENKSTEFLFAAKTRAGEWRVFEKYRKETIKAKTIWSDSKHITEQGTVELGKLGLADLFPFPKPLGLLEDVISIATSDDALILDSFAGSGTTGHAVLEANRRDGGSRRFILVEMEDYADNVTAERIRRVINGYDFEGIQRTEMLRERLNWRVLSNSEELVHKVEGIENLHSHEFDRIKKEVKDGELVVTGEKAVADRADGLGGSFTYCTLGDPVELDKILSGETLPPYSGLGAALFHMATNQSLETGNIREEDFYLGKADGQQVWLIYKPDLDWLKSPEAALTLARAKAFAATDPDKRHLVFAPTRFVSQKMLAEQNLPVEFVPLPFALYRIDRS